MKPVTALAVAAVIASGTLADPGGAHADSRWWGPPAVGGFPPGPVIAPAIAPPVYLDGFYLPAPVYYYLSYYGAPPLPACWGWYRYPARAC